MYKNYFFLILFSWLFYLVPGCKKDLTPIDNTQPKINLTVEDVGVTEAWLRLNIQDLNSKNQITITRDTVTLEHFNTLIQDTLIYDSGLFPNHDYTYTATLLTSNQKPVSSSQQLTTMDTTSHDFTWQTWTFGAKGSSILYDVAIISPDNIWCVGEIYTEDTYTYDSLGNWIDPYNAVHWNGNDWELKRIYFNYQGSDFWGAIYSIFSFNENNIWFGMGSLIHWDGGSFNAIKIPDNIFPSTANKIWGSSSEDLYVVGNDGLIAQYNGQTWRQIESGTESNIHDIWGTNDNILKKANILATVSDAYYSRDQMILSIDSLNANANKIKWPYSLNKPNSIWYMNQNKLWVCGDGLFNYINNEWYEDNTIQTTRFLSRIRGIQLNNIFVVGAFGFISHFNGTSWNNFPETGSSSSFFSLDFDGQIMTAVGYLNNQALLLIMQKN